LLSSFFSIFTSSTGRIVLDEIEKHKSIAAKKAIKIVVKIWEKAEFNEKQYKSVNTSPPKIIVLMF
jgi:hypothetical protein